MHRRGYPIHLIKVINNLYNRTQIRINTNGLSESIEVTQGVGQECTISIPFYLIFPLYK